MSCRWPIIKKKPKTSNFLKHPKSYSYIHVSVCKQCFCPLAWTVDRGESFSLFAASVMSDHHSTTGTFCHKYRKQSTHSWKPRHLPHSQTQLVYLSHIMCLGTVIGCSTLSRQITKPPPWSAATCSMINPMFNLGVSARTNRELWRFVSHQPSRAAVQRIDSLILDWTRNRALARPAVPLKKTKKQKTKQRNSSPSFSSSLPPSSPLHSSCLVC